MEKILLFQSEEYERMKALAGPMRIKVCRIEEKYYKETLQKIYQEKATAEESYQGSLPEGSLMLFCHIDDKKIDKILAAMKRKGIQVDYKAIMTPTNSGWNVLRLYFELERERKAYEQLGKA